MKISQAINTYLILPIIIYSKLKDGRKEIVIGWFNKSYTLVWGKKRVTD
jgi:hypothetical protein